MVYFVICAILKREFLYANSVDHNQDPHSVTFQLCLYIVLLFFAHIVSIISRKS